MAVTMTDLATTKRLARLWAGAETSIALRFEPGDQAPKVAGSGYYHTTPGGKLVRYPNAYGYRTVYHHSTRVVVVGERWSAPDTVTTTDDGVRGEWIRTTARGCRDCAVVRGWVRRDRYTLVRRSDGRTFHAFGWLAAREAVAGAEAAWVRQDQAERANRARQFAGWCPRALPLTLLASREAGNCEAGSMAWARRMRASSGRISVAIGLLAKDQVSHVRRAGEAAARLTDSVPCI